MSEQNRTNRDNCDEIDEAIALAVIQNPSVTDEALAERVGLRRQAVNRRRNSDRVKARIQKLIGIDEEEVRRIAFKAWQRMEECLDSSDPKMRFLAASLIVRQAQSLVTPDPRRQDVFDLTFSINSDRE